MGRSRSSDSDSDYSKSSRRRKGKKEKRRARSRSSSSSSSPYSSSRRSKKSKKKHSSRRPSPSPDRYTSRRRSRSRSADKRASRRSRSRTRSPSYSRDRRSRSPPSRSHKSSKSQKSRRRSRSRSRSYSKGRDEKSSNSQDSYKTKTNEQGALNSSEMAELRMRKALQAAAIADERLRLLEGHRSSKASSSSSPAHPSLTSSREFADSVAAIEDDGFVSSSFKSSRSAAVKEERVDPLMSSHDDAIFGSLSSAGFTIKPDLDLKPVSLDADSIMHPRMFCSQEEKMETWIARLSQLRKRKLEGEVMH